MVASGAVYAYDSEVSISDYTWFKDNRASSSGGKDAPEDSVTWWKYCIRSSSQEVAVLQESRSAPQYFVEIIALDLRHERVFRTFSWQTTIKLLVRA